MLRAMWVVVVLCGCGNSTAAPKSDVDRLALLEEKVAALERYVTTPRASIEGSPEEDAFVGQLDKVLWKTGYLRARGKTEDFILARLRRLDGLVDALGGGRIRGWWCNSGDCFRTKKECIDTSQLTIARSGPEDDGSGCTAVARAWCRDAGTLDCHMIQCADCGVIE